MVGQTKSKNNKTRRFTAGRYAGPLLLLIAIIAVGTWVYSYSFSLFPEQLQYSASLTSAATPVPRSVQVHVLGQYAAISIYSGPSRTAQPFAILGDPTMSQRRTDGRSIIKLKVTGTPDSTSVSPGDGISYMVDLISPLNPGHYKVEVTLQDIARLTTKAHPSYSLTSDFRVG